MGKWRWSNIKAWWENKSESERKRLRSFIPWFLYAFAVLYGVVYLSILNSVNRYNTGNTVKSWFGGDHPTIARLKARQEKEIQESFKGLRKRVSGGR